VVAKVKNWHHSVEFIADGKYSTISNNCARFESNTEVTILFEILNIRTALHWLWFVETAVIDQHHL